MSSETLKQPLSAWGTALLPTLHTFQKQGLFCDVELRSCETLSVMVHSCVLGAASPALCKQMMELSDGVRSAEVDLPGVHLRNLVDFLYTGSWEIGECSEAEVRQAADMFEMTLGDFRMTEDGPTFFLPAGETEIPTADVKFPVVEKSEPELTESISEQPVEDVPVKVEEKALNQLGKSAEMETTATEDVKFAVHRKSEPAVEVADSKSREPIEDVPVKVQETGLNQCDKSAEIETAAVITTQEIKQSLTVSMVSTVCGDGDKENADKEDEKEKTDEMKLEPKDEETAEEEETDEEEKQDPRRNQTDVDFGNAIAHEMDLLSSFHQCVYCWKLCNTLVELDQHKKQHTEAKPFRCKHCDRGFKRSNHRLRHETVHTGLPTPLYKCKFCQAVFMSGIERQLHQMVHKQSPKPYKCHICGTSLQSLDSLKKHQMLHMGERPFKCNLCDKGFTTKVALKRHVETHDGEKKYKCDLCGSRYMYQGNLRTHQRLHKTGKPHRCSYCGNGYSSKSALVEHERIHTGEQPHMCENCGASFKRIKAYRDHMRVHTGERPYDCVQCGKKFRRVDQLRNHERIHTGVKPYLCKICGKAFTAISGRRVHEKIHLKQKPFTCSICNNSFTRKDNLITHQMKIHTTKMETVDTTKMETLEESGMILMSEEGLNSTSPSAAAEEGLSVTSQPEQKGLNPTSRSVVIQTLLRCSVCDQLFQHKNLLIAHQVREHGFQLVSGGGDGQVSEAVDTHGDSVMQEEVEEVLESVVVQQYQEVEVECQ